MKQNSGGGCLTALLALFSRFVLLMFWFSRPLAWEATFSSAILPCLGFLFLPITTFTYAWMMQGVGKIGGLDWLWLILAVILDLATIGSAGAANRDKIPAGAPGSTATPAGTTPAAAPQAPAEAPAPEAPVEAPAPQEPPETP